MKIVECPRDAMQGLSFFVPTQKKITYLNLLLQVGFDTLDFGSFVSPTAVPQMADTAEVLNGLDLTSKTHLLAIVANLRGVEIACSYPSIHYLGYPLSISKTFQQRNTKATIAEGIELVKLALDLCDRSDKDLVVYLSMAFGNPYGDPYSLEMVMDFINLLTKSGCNTISLADTVGLASEKEILDVGIAAKRNFEKLEIGMHLHTNPTNSMHKTKAVWDSGIRRIDTAMGGLGGCPFAEDDLVGNLATETLLKWSIESNIDLGLDKKYFEEASTYLKNGILS